MSQTHEPAHAKFAPSSSSQWIPCPPSADFEDTESGHEANRGTLIHDMAADGKRPYPRDWTQEDADIADKCLDVWNKALPEGCIREQKLYSKFAPHLFFGTIDALLMEGTHCSIWDLKTGLKRVDSFENTQLMCYLLLVLENYPHLETFEGTVIQPQLFYREAVSYTREEILLFRAVVIEAMTSNVFKAGAHCRYCPARSNCDVLHDYLVENLTMPNTVEKATWLITNKKVIESQIEAATGLLRAKLLAGEKLNGVKLKTGRKMRYLGVAPEKLIDYIGSSHFVADPRSIVYEEKVRTVAQIEIQFKEATGEPFPDEFVDTKQATPSVISSLQPDVEGDEFE